MENQYIFVRERKVFNVFAFGIVVVFFIIIIGSVEGALEDGMLDGQEGYKTLESGIIVDDSFDLDSELEGSISSNKQSKDTPFYSSLMFRIIIIALVLTVIAIIVFFIYSKLKDKDTSSEISEDVPKEDLI